MVRFVMPESIIKFQLYQPPIFKMTTGATIHQSPEVTMMDIVLQSFQNRVCWCMIRGVLFLCL